MPRRHPEDGSQPRGEGSGGGVGPDRRREGESPLLNSKLSAGVFVLTGAANVKQEQRGRQKEPFIYPHKRPNSIRTGLF